MIILVILAISLVIAIVRGGKFNQLADIDLRWRGMFIAGFLLQVLIFSDGWQTRPELNALTRYVYVGSMMLVFAAVAYNFRIPGMRFVAVGLAANLLAIVFNGGYMPASPEALTLAGYSAIPGRITNNSIVMDANTALYFLCDIFAIPKGFIFPNVFSIGDVLLTLGGVYLIQKSLVKPKMSQAQQTN
ncbi:MAG: DUF5317 domain-containing protein [Chloroflexi bacterium]|nr:DUF5317 domain-containing protein [Chloroflexota bacterium]